MPIDLTKSPQAILVDLVNESLNKNYEPDDIIFRDVQAFTVPGQNTNTRVIATGSRKSDFLGPTPLYYNRLNISVLLQNVDAELEDHESLVNSSQLVQLFNEQFGVALELGDLVPAPINRTGPGPYTATIQIRPGHLVFFGAIDVTLVEGTGTDPVDLTTAFVAANAFRFISTNDFQTIEELDITGKPLLNNSGNSFMAASGNDRQICAIRGNSQNGIDIYLSLNGGGDWDFYQIARRNVSSGAGRMVFFHGRFYLVMGNADIDDTGLFELNFSGPTVTDFKVLDLPQYADARVAASADGAMAVALTNAQPGQDIFYTFDAADWFTKLLDHNLATSGTPTLAVHSMAMVGTVLHFVGTANDIDGQFLYQWVDLGVPESSWSSDDSVPATLISSPIIPDNAMIVHAGGYLLVAFGGLYDFGVFSMDGAIWRKDISGAPAPWIAVAEDTELYPYDVIHSQGRVIVTGESNDTDTFPNRHAMTATGDFSAWTYIDGVDTLFGEGLEQETDRSGSFVAANYQFSVTAPPAREFEVITNTALQDSPGEDAVGPGSGSLFKMYLDPVTGSCIVPGYNTMDINGVPTQVIAQRFLVDGSLDTSFAIVGSNSNSPLSLMRYDAVSGKLYGIGSNVKRLPGDQAGSRLIRYNLDGSVDTSFPDQVFTNSGGFPIQSHIFVIDDAGNLYVPTTQDGELNGSPCALITKISTTGVHDTSFVPAVGWPPGTPTFFHRFSNGQMLLSGFNINVVMFNADGSNATGQLGITGGGVDIRGAYEHSDGSVVLVGSGMDVGGNNGQSVVRYTSKWVLDTNFDLTVGSTQGFGMPYDVSYLEEEDVYILAGSFDQLTGPNGLSTSPFIGKVGLDGTTYPYDFGVGFSDSIYDVAVWEEVGEPATYWMIGAFRSVKLTPGSFPRENAVRRRNVARIIP